jgi:hypothetical protein
MWKLGNVYQVLSVFTPLEGNGMVGRVLSGHVTNSYVVVGISCSF